MWFKIIFGLVTSVVFFFIINKVLYFNKRQNEIIKVQISLINKCELYDRAFMVKALPSGKVAKFKDKRASLFLKRSSKVKLIASNEFPGFHYSSVPVKVNYDTTLTADCSNSDRLDNIFDSFNKQFNKDAN